MRFQGVDSKVNLAPNRRVAFSFLTVGVLICLPVGALSLLSLMWHEQVPLRGHVFTLVFKVILSMSPLIIYFSSGFFAALSRSYWIRVFLALSAHIIFLLITLSAWDKNFTQVVTILILSLSVSWVKILKNE